MLVAEVIAPVPERLAIIGILVGLLLPAVQAAREAARRMQCSNNLKQIGLAAHNYESSLKVLPSGYVRKNGQEGWGWAALLLPYIEQGSLYEQLGVSRGNLNQIISSPPANFAQLIQTPISSFICPSDSGYEGNGILPDLPAGRERFSIGGTEIKVALSNYKAAAGVLAPQHEPSGNNAVSRDSRGVFYGNSRLSISGITDGSSNTMAFGEAGTKIRRGGAWLGSRINNNMGHSSVYYVVSWAGARLNQPDVSPFPTYGKNGGPDDNPGFNTAPGCGKGFGSLHARGANFCYADGSVHFISQDIEHRPQYTATDLGPAEQLGLYQKLMCRNDGAVLTNSN